MNYEERRDAARRSDAAIRKEVSALLSGRDDLDTSHADVMVSDGIVVLLGSVPNYETKRQIEALCERIPGVHEIHDQLLVGPVNPDADPGGLRTEDPRADFRGPGS
jgi:osmotically-inducible protein OsmY